MHKTPLALFCSYMLFRKLPYLQTLPKAFKTRCEPLESMSKGFWILILWLPWRVVLNLFQVTSNQNVSDTFWDFETHTISRDLIGDPMSKIPVLQKTVLLYLKILFPTTHLSLLPSGLHHTSTILIVSMNLCYFPKCHQQMCVTKNCHNVKLSQKVCFDYVHCGL